MNEHYVYKKEIDWSTLTEGITLPVENQVVFGRIMDRFLKPGEQKEIKLIFNGNTFNATINNVGFNGKWRDSHKKDILQIRYRRNGELSQALKMEFSSSYSYLYQKRVQREPGNRTRIRVPDESREYLAIYTTEYDDTYLLESICVEDRKEIRKEVSSYSELEIENQFDYATEDPSSTILTKNRTVKIRRLNASIGNNLKLLYNYRCQICGKLIGEEYAQHIAEAHHIDYFVHSLNNDSSNLLIVCPNHHSIIHSANPVFDKSNLAYIYDNGMTDTLKLNLHL